MATASSVTGVGQGSADKAGQKGSEHLYVGVEKLIGVRVVVAGTITLASTTGTVTFPTVLSGVAADYIAICNGAHLTYGTSLTTAGFTVNGTSADVISYIVVRVNNATVTVN
jgi:hypothetical protein